ncbi:hypothetical protein V4U86_11200 [Mycobacterium sp. AMU20-3851]|jgi:hypothetical protein|uniref:hypothetical protein n=1 Tax=Mycobacterium sp. AMU20-3851 TaxID=3122055 RepID=UPI00375505B8
MASEGGDNDGLGRPLPTPARRFGRLPNLDVAVDFDEPLPPAEVDAWECVDSGDQDQIGEVGT